MSFIGNTPSLVPLSGSQIADGTIVNANIATSTINLTQKVTATLPVAQGGTGVSTYTAGNILYASNATTLATLAPGTSGYALTLNGTTPTWAAVGASAGQVIQVLSTTDSVERTITSTSFVTGSNTLSVTITPSSSSNKILILVSTSVSDANQSFHTIYRNGSTNLGNGNYGLSGSNNYFVNLGINYLDSPATTSATTYQLYWRAAQGTSSQINWSTVKGSITCLEIKG